MHHTSLRKEAHVDYFVPLYQAYTAVLQVFDF